MSNDLALRMLRERIAKGEATGILCAPEEVAVWKERLERDVPLLQRVGEDTLFAHTGAVIGFCTTPEEASAWERRQTGSVIWIDDDNRLDAPLPAPKPDSER